MENLGLAILVIMILFSAKSTAMIMKSDSSATTSFLLNVNGNFNGSISIPEHHRLTIEDEVVDVDEFFVNPELGKSEPLDLKPLKPEAVIDCARGKDIKSYTSCLPGLQESKIAEHCGPDSYGRLCYFVN